MQNKHKNGFSLIELMITVAIVAILAAIAYPSYTQYITQSRRADAQAALMGLASAMERYYTSNDSYLGAAGTKAVPLNTGTPWIYPAQSPLDGNTKYYNLSITAATATAYDLRATPINAQVGNGLLEITSTGVKRWDKNDDGDTADTGEDNWSK